MTDHRINPKKNSIIIQWYLQQHGSFSSGGRWRDISLLSFSSNEQLSEYLLDYIKRNSSDVNDEQKNIVDLCRIAVEQSNQLLDSNREELSRVTSRHIWPVHHKLIIGCLFNAHIIATCHDQFNGEKRPIEYEKEEENGDRSYCLITQLGNDPTHIQFVHGTHSLRNEILKRFEHPFKNTMRSSSEQIDLFRQHTERLSIQEFCNYVTSNDWHHLDNQSLWGVLVDFILVGQPLFFDQDIQ